MVCTALATVPRPLYLDIIAHLAPKLTTVVCMGQSVSFRMLQ